METRILTVTPAMATHWLNNTTTKNRKIDPIYVANLAKDMQMGKWKELTGEAIKFSGRNNLIDGFHRLNAIIKSGKSLKMLAINNLEDDVFKFLDSGRKRSAGDVLTIAGVGDSSNMASGIKRFEILKNNRIVIQEPGNSKQKLTSNDVYNIYMSDSQSFDISLKKAASWYLKFRLISRSEYMAIYHLLKVNYPEKIESFFNEVANGTNLNMTNPAYHLREFFIKNNSSKFRVKNSFKIIYIIIAWNAYVLNREIKVLRFNPDIQEVPKWIK